MHCCVNVSNKHLVNNHSSNLTCRTQQIADNTYNLYIETNLTMIPRIKIECAKVQAKTQGKLKP